MPPSQRYSAYLPTDFSSSNTKNHILFSFSVFSGILRFLCILRDSPWSSETFYSRYTTFGDILVHATLRHIPFIWYFSDWQITFHRVPHFWIHLYIIHSIPISEHNQQKNSVVTSSWQPRNTNFSQISLIFPRSPSIVFSRTKAIEVCPLTSWFSVHWWAHTETECTSRP